MKFVTFSTLELLQQADEALQTERVKTKPDRFRLNWPKRRRMQLADRLRRTLGTYPLAQV